MSVVYLCVCNCDKLSQTGESNGWNMPHACCFERKNLPTMQCNAKKLDGQVKLGSTGRYTIRRVGQLGHVTAISQSESVKWVTCTTWVGQY